MLVQPAALRADLAQAVARITRVTLADLLGNLGGNAREQQAFANLLRSNAPLTARVLETRADGVSVLELVNTRVAIRLASAHAPGDLLTIALDDAAGDTAPRAAAAAAVKLSAPALLISDIQKSDLNQIHSETVSTEPVTHKAAPPHALAHALQQTVRQSGLFYESHLRGWVDGRVALESVLEEPQARIAELPSQRAGEARETVHPQLEPLVRQQLETLERQSIVWRGCLWPGQQAEIEISGTTHKSNP